MSGTIKTMVAMVSFKTVYDSKTNIVWQFQYRIYAFLHVQ